VTADPVAALWHYLNGRMCDWHNGNDGPVVWRSGSHRGVQWLEKVEFPRKQKRYIFSPLFDIRYDTAFEEVMRGCADITREGKTWISEEFIRAMIALNKMGFAHSWEAWSEGKLAGGCFGVQLGSIITCDSMFHTVSNASKAAYGQTLVRLRERGFRFVDTNGVAAHKVNYGEEWMQQWQYEKCVKEYIRESPSLTDERPYPKFPWEVRVLLPVARIARRIKRKLRPQKTPPPPPPAQPTTVEQGGMGDGAALPVSSAD
jgi:leucyl/phenylalanyl-tRNA--protein transferase